MMTNAVFLSLALALQAPAAPAPPTPQSDVLAEAYYLFLQGKELEGQNELDGAADRYRQALNLLPEAAEIRSDLAGVYAQQGNLDGARREAEHALVLAPGSRSAHRLMGLLTASSLDRTPSDQTAAVVQTAIEHLERSRADGIRDPAIMLTLGDLYVRGGQHARAIAILQDFLIDRPGFPQAMLLLAHAYRASGQDEMAESVFRAFRGNDAESAAARLRSIDALEARGAWRDAAEAWARLVDDQPSESAYRLRYAAALVNSGRLEEGRDQLLTVTRDQPDDVRAWYLLAQVEQRAGRTEAAERAARRIVEIDPEDGRGPLALASILARRDDHRGVVDLLAARVEAPTEADLGTTTFVQMATFLSDAWVGLGQARRGIRVLENARKRAPDDQALLFSLASAYEQDDQVGPAERAFREILVADPDHAAALNYLGYMLADRGRKLPEALALIERAIAVGGENPAYLDSLGWTYFRMSRFEDAIDPLERAARGAPRVSVILDHLGDLYMKLERYDQAVSAFEGALDGDLDGIDERALIRKRDRARAASAGR